MRSEATQKRKVCCPFNGFGLHNRALRTASWKRSSFPCGLMPYKAFGGKLWQFAPRADRKAHCTQAQFA